MEKNIHVVSLIPIVETNIKIYLSLFSPNLWPYLHVANRADEEEYLLQSMARKKRGIPTFFYLIYIVEKDCYVGAIQIRLPHENSGQLYCWIHERYWGQGYLKPAIELAADNYFNQTELNQFSALVYFDNQRSYHALKKAGFIDAGTVEGVYGKQHLLTYLKKLLV
jgi:RimJ/RimL family protein N-acetyltransferase